MCTPAQEIEPAQMSPAIVASPVQQMGQTGAGSVVKPIASQTPINVVPYVVTTPTAYTSTASNGATATYLIQPGQHVYTMQPGNVVAMPQDSQQPVHYVIRDRPNPSQTRESAPHPGNRATPLTSPVLSQVSILPSSHQVQPARVGYNVVTSRLSQTSTPVQQQDHVVYCATSSKASGSSVHAPALQAVTSAFASTKTRPCAVVSALPAYTPTYTQSQLGQHSHVLCQPSDTGGRVILSSGGTPPEKPQATQPATSAISMPGVVVTKSVPHQRSSHIQSPSDRPLEQLGEITKKIEKAFSTFNEDMLMSAFREACVKFQANQAKYKALEEQNTLQKLPTAATSETPRSIYPPPNAEVVCRPGSLPTVSLVRQSSARPTVTHQRVQTSTTPVPHLSPVVHQQVQPSQAPPRSHPLPAAKAKVQSASSQGQQGAPTQQYLYTYSSNSSHPILVQHGNDYELYTITSPSQSLKSPSTHFQQPQQPQQQQQQQQQQQPATQVAHHVQTAGLYYPEHVPLESSTKKTEGTTAASPQLKQQQQQQQQPVVITQPVVHPQQPAQASLPAAGPPSQSARKSFSPRRRMAKSARRCVQCSKEATYLCSGCHHVWYCGKECQVCCNFV